MEDLLEKSRCSNLPLMHVNSIIWLIYVPINHYVYKAFHKFTNKMFLLYSCFVLCAYHFW
jgi:hypothetical protein